MSDPPIAIFVDADACPVKDETYRVAQRYGCRCYVVANSFMMVPVHPLIARIVVRAGPDVTDDWIAERASVGDIVITSDIPLADRVLARGAVALAPTGRAFVRTAVAANGSEPREEPPKPFTREDRSRFLQRLDEAINRERRRRR